MSAIGLYTGEMLGGAVVTLELAIGGSVVSLIVGAIAAIGRIYGPKPLRTFIYGYVELIRGLPAILQLFILYFGLTQFGLNIPTHVSLNSRTQPVVPGAPRSERRHR